MDLESGRKRYFKLHEGSLKFLDGLAAILARQAIWMAEEERKKREAEVSPADAE